MVIYIIHEQFYHMDGLLCLLIFNCIIKTHALPRTCVTETHILPIHVLPTIISEIILDIVILRALYKAKTTSPIMQCNSCFTERLATCNRLPRHLRQINQAAVDVYRP